MPEEATDAGGTSAAHGTAGLSTAPSKDAWSESDVKTAQDEGDDDDRKAHVAKYNQNVPFPFETGETVWVWKPGYRAPLGEFRITKVHPDDVFELTSCTTNTPHTELVEGKYLRRDP